MIRKWIKYLKLPPRMGGFYERFNNTIHRTVYLEGIDMQKAGGIISLIAGIFGTIAAIATLFMGGLGGGRRR